MVDAIVILNRILGNKNECNELKNITGDMFLSLIKEQLTDKEYYAIINEEHNEYESIGYRKLRRNSFIKKIKQYFA